MPLLLIAMASDLIVFLESGGFSFFIAHEVTAYVERGGMIKVKYFGEGSSGTLG